MLQVAYFWLPWGAIVIETMYYIIMKDLEPFQFSFYCTS